MWSAIAGLPARTRIASWPGCGRCRRDLIDPTIAVHHGRVVKRTGDGSIIEFRSIVDAVRCAIEVQNAMVERNAGVPEDRRIVFRIGIHLGDVVEESDGDLMGDGVNIAARLEGIAEPGASCLSEQVYWQVKSRLELAVSDLGNKELKNIVEPVRACLGENERAVGREQAPAGCRLLLEHFSKRQRFENCSRRAVSGSKPAPPQIAQQQNAVQKALGIGFSGLTDLGMDCEPRSSPPMRRGGRIDRPPRQALRARSHWDHALAARVATAR